MLRSERGVTLIEILMALAITSLLASTILFGRDQLRIKQQFSQGVDQMVETIANVRNQATTTVGQTGAGGTGGGSGNEATYGKLMEIGTDGNITISTETIDDPNTGTGAVVQDHVDPYNVQIPWGVVPFSGGAPNNVNILFGLQSGGSIAVYYNTGNTGINAVPRAGDADRNDSSQMTSADAAALNFTIQDSHGNQAVITVDRYGNVSRQIL